MFPPSSANPSLYVQTWVWTKRSNWESIWTIRNEGQGTKTGVPLTYVYPRVFNIVFWRDSWELWPIFIPTKYRAYIGISHRGTLVGVHPTMPWEGVNHELYVYICVEQICILNLYVNDILYFFHLVNFYDECIYLSIRYFGSYRYSTLTTKLWKCCVPCTSRTPDYRWDGRTVLN